MLIVLTHGGGIGRCTETLVAYDPSSDSWRDVSRVPTPTGCFEGADRPVWTGHELLLWGISNAAYNPATDTWRQLGGYPDGGPSVIVWTGTQMLGWGGGCCDQESADGAAYTLATNSWRELPTSPLLGRHTAGAWTGTEMIIAGGSGYPTAPSDPHFTPSHVHFSDAAAYDPGTHTWRKLPPMPIGRGGSYEVLWDGKELLVFGGTTTGGTEPIARGVAYDPSTNQWRWLAAPAFPRDQAMYMWDGREVLMWGGLGLDGAVPPHGEAYDPATDTWSSLPKAPLRGRVGANVVWIGSELIIWGGIDVRTATPEGGLFDGAAFMPASA